MSLLIGEAASAEVVEGMRRLIEAEAAKTGAIRRIHTIRTMHLGPQDVLATVRIVQGHGQRGAGWSPSWETWNGPSKPASQKSVAGFLQRMGIESLECALGRLDTRTFGHRVSQVPEVQRKTDQPNSAGIPSLAWIAFASRGPMPKARRVWRDIPPPFAVEVNAHERDSMDLALQALGTCLTRACTSTGEETLAFDERYVLARSLAEDFNQPRLLAIVDFSDHILRLAASRGASGRQPRPAAATARSWAR